MTSELCFDSARTGSRTENKHRVQTAVSSEFSHPSISRCERGQGRVASQAVLTFVS